MKPNNQQTVPKESVVAKNTEFSGSLVGSYEIFLNFRIRHFSNRTKFVPSFSISFRDLCSKQTCIDTGFIDDESWENIIFCGTDSFESHLGSLSNALSNESTIIRIFEPIV